jgi:hypothetical protein
MLWIGICEAVCVAGIGGLFGGFVMALGHRANEKFNMKMMEDYWNADIKRLESRLEVLDQKISTVSVAKPVNNHENKYRNKGYSHQRHFNQRG